MTASNRHKLVKVEKDGQEGLVDPVQIKGLRKHGWTVVDDGNSESGQAPVEQAVVAEDQSPEHKE